MIACFADYEIDLDRLEIRSAGDIIAVEPQVFDVLSYLLEHRERMVTKEELLDNVWGDRFVTESALTSRIKSARRALGDDGRTQAVIRTVHGRGYQFVADLTMAADVVRPARSTPRPIEPPATDAPLLDTAWPLVGRHDEVDELGRLLHNPARSGVLLTGPASIGKTRLARVCVDRAKAEGIPVAHVSGHAKAEQIPLAALAHLLPAEILEAGDTRGEMARTVVFQRARTAIRDLSGDDRLVILVDNADHIDELSAALLGSLIASGSVFAVLTQRTTEHEPLVFDELVRNGQLAHIDLGPLDDTDLDVLLYRVLAGPIDLDSLQQLTSLSRGRPGVLQQLVETCLATQALDREADVWRIVGPIQPALGMPGPDQLVLSSLEPGAATGAELLAVAHEIDLETATELIGSDELDVLDRAGLLALAESADGLRVSIAHAHIGILLEERLGPLRARRHKTRLINAMVLERATDHDKMRRVRWMLETGTSPDLADALSAARFAVANADGAAAEVILDHLDGTNAANEAVQLRAELHFRRGQVNLAEELLEQVDVEGLDQVTAASVVRRLATIRFHVRGRFTEALALLDEASERFDGPARNLVVAHWIGLQGFLAGADALIERVDSLPGDLEHGPHLEVLRGLAQAHVARGSFDVAITTLDRHDVDAGGLPSAVARAGYEVALTSRIAAHTASGDIRQATDLVRRHLPVGRRTMLAWLPMAAARTELMAGRSRVAFELISTPLAAVRSQNLIHAEPQMLGILAQTTLRLGDPELAARHADECWQALDSLVGHLGWALLLSIADVEARTGIRAGLTERLVNEADAAHGAGALLFEAELLMAAARVGHPGIVADRLSEVVARLGGSLWSVRAQHAHALIDRDEAKLRTVEAAYRTQGYDGYADGVAHTLASTTG